MEHQLHQDLKALYGVSPSQREVTIEGFRIDAVVRGRLIEIQVGSLGALQRKVITLLENHRVTVVKPLVRNRRISWADQAKAARMSPAHATWLDAFTELVHFTKAFPHPKLTLELLLVDVEECRRRTRGRKGFRREFQRLVTVGEKRKLKTVQDLRKMIPEGLPDEFSTADLARVASVPRWLAQKMAYCLRETGATETLARRRAGWLYRWTKLSESRRRAA